MTPARASLYVGAGRVLTHWALDADSATLRRRDTLQLPGAVQSGHAHPVLPVLYISCGAPDPDDPDGQWVCVVRLDPGTGAPTGVDDPVRLPGRALDLTSDPAGDHLVLAHTRPAAVSVYRLAPDGAVGGSVDRRVGTDAVGVFPHQVTVTPDGRWVTVVARGIPSAHPGRAARDPQREPGSVRLFPFRDGRLGTADVLAPGDGWHFGPRNLAVDATGTRVYLALETQNELLVLRRDADGGLINPPTQRFSTLVRPDATIHQGLGPIVLHPRGHVLYVANRAYRPEPDAPRTLPAGAENSIVAYAVGPDGHLSALQRLDSGGACPRSLALDPTGRTLVVTNSETWDVEDGAGTRRLPTNLATFDVAADGRLTARHRHLVGDGAGPALAWAGIVTHDRNPPPRTDTA